MKSTRTGSFETNSSSTHALCISLTKELDDLTEFETHLRDNNKFLLGDADGLSYVGYDTYDSVNMRVWAVVTAICRDGEKLDKLTSIIKETFPQFDGFVISTDDGGDGNIPDIFDLGLDSIAITSILFGKGSLYVHDRDG